LSGFSSSAGAQVATHSLYQGRLTHTTGAPKTGPVDLTLRIFDAATLGNQLYSEQHLAVVLGPGGSFAVALGSGTNPDGNYETALQTAAPLYLEVEADGDLLSPRQPIASAPVAVAAASLTPAASRFEDCADGTVADHQTGLLWEKKTGTPSVMVFCISVPGGCSNPRDVNNRYRWSASASDPDGNVFTDFLARLNDPFLGSAATSTDVTGCFAAHCDWRLPGIVELTTILVGRDAAPGQSATCSAAPCIDPAFAAVGGPTSSENYWSASSFATNPNFAWGASFQTAFVFTNFKANDNFVRAVRSGSCDE
jgi:hypothetical protein